MSFLSNKNIQTSWTPQDDVAMKLYYVCILIYSLNLARSRSNPRQMQTAYTGLSEFLKVENLGDFRDLANDHKIRYIKERRKDRKTCYDFLDLNKFLKVRRMTPFMNSRVQEGMRIITDGTCKPFDLGKPWQIKWII